MTAAALYLIRNHCRLLYLRCLQFRQDQNDLTAPFSHGAGNHAGNYNNDPTLIPFPKLRFPLP